MPSEIRSRRHFLLGAGTTAAGVALDPRLLLSQSTNSPDASARRKALARGKMRGLMVDAGRVPEPLGYYRRLIDLCAVWELNTLHFRLADDQGSALRFASAPDLVAHRNAFAPEELNGLAEYAKARGIDVIPELESFGHTGYITRAPAYAHLLDRDVQGDSEFTGVIPVNPETLQLFEMLYKEVAAIFPSAYLHGGCDEVNWGGSELSRKALQAKTRVQVWADYLNSLCHIASGLGKQLIIWGDVVVHNNPDILPALEKSIVIMDWNYREQDPAQLLETIKKIGEQGHRAIGAPALANYRWGPRVGAEQLRNIGAFADAYLDREDPTAMGVISTNWIPSRYVQNSIWDGFFYAAIALNEGSAAAESTAFRRFVEGHYGARWNEVWSETFRTIYAAAPSIQEESASSNSALRLRTPWSNDAELAATLRIEPYGQNPFARLRGLLVRLKPTVRKNVADFQAFVLCVEALHRMFWRELVVIEKASTKAFDRKATDGLIAEIAHGDRDLAEALSRDWDQGRFRDSLAKSELLPDLEPKDQLLFEWVRAADYSAKLATHPERFNQLLSAAKA